MPTREIKGADPEKSKKKPVPKPEGDHRISKSDDFDPLSRKDYKDHDGDAADPQRVGPGT